MEIKRTLGLEPAIEVSVEVALTGPAQSKTIDSNKCHDLDLGLFHRLVFMAVYKTVFASIPQ